MRPTATKLNSGRGCNVRLFTGSSPKTIAAWVGHDAYRRYFGQLNSPRASNSPSHALSHGIPWAVDNDAFKHFDARRFASFIERHQGVPGCRFVCAPDVVGNAYSTLLLFSEWQPRLKRLGYPVALVAQDGLEHLIIPWGDFDTLFIGGSTPWKEGSAAALLAREAQRRRKWVHMGRVNGFRRMRYARYLGCDSVDGTHWVHEPRACREALAFLARPFERVKTIALQQELL